MSLILQARQKVISLKSKAAALGNEARGDLLRILFSKRFVRLWHFNLFCVSLPFAFCFYVYETPYFTEMRRERLYLKYVEAPKMEKRKEGEREEEFLTMQRQLRKEYPR